MSRATRHNVRIVREWLVEIGATEIEVTINAHGRAQYVYEGHRYRHAFSATPSDANWFKQFQRLHARLVRAQKLQEQQHAQPSGSNGTCAQAGR